MTRWTMFLAAVLAAVFGWSAWTAAGPRVRTRAIERVEYAAEPPTESEEFMATPNYWVSATGDATAATGWSLGHVPGAGEVAIFTGAKTNQSCTLNMSGAAVGPAEFVVRNDYYGNIGGPGNYYTHLATNTTKIVITGHGDYYLTPIVTGGYTVVNTAGGFVGLSGAFLQNIDVVKGRVTIGQNSSFRQGAHVRLWGELAYLTIEASTGTSYPILFLMRAGRLVNHNELDHGSNDVVTAILTGGEWTQYGIVDTGAYVSVMGGTFIYTPNADPSAVSPHFYVDGLLDVEDSEYPIPASALVVGPAGEIRGSAIETLNTGIDLDLRKVYP